MLSLLSLVKKLCAEGLFVGLLTSLLMAQSSNVDPKSPANPYPPTHSSPSQSKTSPYLPKSVTKHARDYYQVAWGVDSFAVRSVESGEMIRFSYRVVNVEKAKVLNDKKNAPYLVDEKAHVKLVVPTMEKVGQLRQSSTPEEGKVYWMVFSNKGHIVKPGSRVSVIIGKFHADGLVVEGS